MMIIREECIQDMKKVEIICFYGGTEGDRKQLGDSGWQVKYIIKPKFWPWLLYE